MLQIALVGCGAIGASVLELLQGRPGLRVAWVLVPQPRPEHQALVQRFAPGARLQTALAEGERPDLLVECAGHGALAAHVLPALRRGIPAVLASVGALSTEGMAEQLEAAARAGATQVQLLSGAVGGIDALAAARIGGLDDVVYTGRKPPLAWRGTPAEAVCTLTGLDEAVCIFDGSAREAARRFPKNANVAATLALAGLGLDATRVRLYADPGVQHNVHEVQARGAFGSLELRMQGQPLAANPKTSALTAYSVVRAVCNRAAAVWL